MYLILLMFVILLKHIKTTWRLLSLASVSIANWVKYSLFLKEMKAHDTLINESFMVITTDKCNKQLQWDNKFKTCNFCN